MSLMSVLNKQRTRTSAHPVGKDGFDGVGPSARPSLVNPKQIKKFTNTANFSPNLDITPSTLPNTNKVKANYTCRQRAISTNATGIVDSGAINMYFANDSPVVNINRSSPRVTVGTTTGQTQQSTGTCNLDLPHPPLQFPNKGHLMPGFCHT